MAISKTNEIDPAEAAPFNACTCTSTVNAGDLIVALHEVGATMPDAQITGLTMSDNVNSGGYTRVGQQVFSDNNEVDTLFYKVANASGTPTLSTSTINAAYTGKISCLTFTGFAGTPFLDSVLGNPQATQAAGATSVTAFSGFSTLRPNSVAICQFFTRGTFFSPVPTGWTFGQSQFYVYKIAAALNTSLQVTGTYSGTTTGSGAMFMLADFFDATLGPLVGQTTPTNISPSANVGNSFFWQNFTAYQSGTATTLNVAVQNPETSTILYLGIYNSGGTLLASGSVAPTAGVMTVSIPNTPIVYGQTYSLAWSADHGLLLCTNQNGSSISNTTTVTGAPPASLPASNNNPSYGSFSIYASGVLATPAAGVPVGGPARTQYHWRSSGGGS